MVHATQEEEEEEDSLRCDVNYRTYVTQRFRISEMIKARDTVIAPSSNGN